MSETTHFEWDLPTPGGDPGIWDEILNSTIDDIDSEMLVAQAAAGAKAHAAEVVGSYEVDYANGGTQVLTMTGPTLVTGVANVPEGAVRLRLVFISAALSPTFDAKFHLHRMSVTAVNGSTRVVIVDVVTTNGGTTWYGRESRGI